MEQRAQERTAVVIPGGRYGPNVPLLAYAYAAAGLRGARIRRVTWSPPASLFGGLAGVQGPEAAPAEGRVVGFEAVPVDPDADPLTGWVRAEISPVLDELAADVPAPLLIGKSLGSCAAPLAAERGLPAVWLTPLLQREAVVRALRRATVPYLLIGGTADTRWWDGALARSLSPHVLEVPDADHGMQVPGRLAASATVLGRVATAIEDFLDQVVWPS